MRIRFVITLLLLAATALAACSPQSGATQASPPSSASSATQAPPAAAANGAMVQLAKSDQLGSFLADSKGMTLYLFLKDTADTSNCYNGCAKSWPPLLTSGKPVAGDGLDASKLGTTARTDGTTQVTYNGWPLYYFAKDKQPGDTAGQDVGKVWFVISPAGDKVEASASTPMVMPTAAAASGSGDVPVTEGSAVSVSITGFAFDPAALKIHQGTTVTWTNNDSPPHTVTSDTGVFDSGTLKPGATFSFTFKDAGTFTYHCKIHTNMKATIIVVP